MFQYVSPRPSCYCELWWFLKPFNIQQGCPDCYRDVDDVDGRGSKPKIMEKRNIRLLSLVNQDIILSISAPILPSGAPCRSPKEASAPGGLQLRCGPRPIAKSIDCLCQGPMDVKWS